ncbi:autophagy-related 16 [Chlorella sorokiniana]|uniref:Autophagy-related 16 n=1 Tax=Chlorella sorokiniana TaxID=3076 RepID=A0A2P6TMB6_CHLSO|nr:autophagy-related 16 [Chlorella sorokiniana]|eukprot:PRW45473.1 autophagy-related 16 [Chlorella sorokiniana]
MLAATRLSGHWLPTQRPSSAMRQCNKQQLQHVVARSAADDGAAAEQPQPQQQAALPRRSALAAALAAAAAPWLASGPALADNDAVKAGLAKYVKKKKLERLDSYVPPLLAARDQLIRIGRVMLQDPANARQLLRSGEFSGLRDNVRSLGEYASQRAGDESGRALVRGFFTALEALDGALRQAERGEEGLPEGARAKLDATVEALDKLLATVPEEDMQRAQRVRCAQLDKEASELRLENETLLRTVEDGKHAAVQSAQFAALEARAQSLQDELTAAYKDKAALAEQSLQATRQLQVVRDINERQARELTDAAEEARRLKEQIKELRGQVDHFREAHATVSREMEARLQEAQGATAKLATVEAESAELVRRLIEMKDREADRMNEINRLEAETIARAKQEAAAVLARAAAKAQALGAALGRQRTSEGAELVEASMRRLSEADKVEQPSTLMKSVPGHDGGCYGLAFNRTGELLASGGADKCVKLWDPFTAAVKTTLRGAFEGINGVAFTSDSKLVLAADNKQAVRVWEVATGRLRHSLTGHTGKVVGVACSPADPHLAVSCGSERAIKVWGLTDGLHRRSMMCPSICNSLAITADGSLVASGHFDGTLRFWDLRTGRVAHEVAGLHSPHGGITSVDTGSSGALVLTCGKDNLLRCVDVRRFEVRHTLSAPSFSVGGAWTTACFSPTEQQAAAGSADGTVFLWDIAKSTVAARLRDPKQHQPAVACAWCPLGLPLVSCDKAGAISFWTGRASKRASGSGSGTSGVR